MSQNNDNPAPTPGTPGQPAGQGATPANVTPAPGANQPNGGNNGGQKIELDSVEVEKLKRDAGRWNAYQKENRENRRNNRGANRQPDYQDLDGAKPEILEALRSRDIKLDELSLTNRELAVKDKVRDLFDSEEYKNIPIAVRKAIIRNPLGFVNRTSESLEDAVADIQEYLDDEIDHPSGGQPAAPVTPAPETHQVPPASGSGPASPNAAVEVDVTGKTGPARSTAILGNLLKNRGK